MKLAILLLCVVAATIVSAQSCVYYNDEVHQFYSLTPLSQEGPFSFVDNSTGYTYEVAFCGSTDECLGDAVCQSDSVNTFGCGSSSALAFSPYLENITKDGVSISYFAGDMCGSAGVARRTSINIACDLNVAYIEFDFVEEASLCHYVISARSPYGCGV